MLGLKQRLLMINTDYDFFKIYFHSFVFQQKAMLKE